MKKLNIGIIFGGQSTEHEISLKSAKNIVDMIDKNRFEVVLINIDKKGQWFINDVNSYLFNSNYSNNVILNHSRKRIAIFPGNKQGQLINPKNSKILAQIDVAFPIIHGLLGEDGSLQGIFQIINLPFVGSNVLGSAVCMDKDICKRLLREAGLKVTPFVTLTRKQYSKNNFIDLCDQLGLPLFIKPANQGSSIGVSKVNNKTQFSHAMDLAFKFDNKIIIEKNITGREIECAILGNDDPQTSMCGELLLNNDFYSYENKYVNNNKKKFVVPAVLPSSINNAIQNIALSAYRILNCSGMARVDVFLTSNNEIIINEINTLPGFTNVSTYPKLWKASGLSYTALISKLIELALEQHTNHRIILTALDWFTNNYEKY